MPSTYLHSLLAQSGLVAEEHLAATDSFLNDPTQTQLRLPLAIGHRMGPAVLEKLESRDDGARIVLSAGQLDIRAIDGSMRIEPAPLAVAMLIRSHTNRIATAIDEALAQTDRTPVSVTADGDTLVITTTSQSA